LGGGTSGEKLASKVLVPSTTLTLGERAELNTGIRPVGLAPGLEKTVQP
jgi:hypothetical protein